MRSPPRRAPLATAPPASVDPAVGGLRIVLPSGGTTSVIYHVPRVGAAPDAVPPARATSNAAWPLMWCSSPLSQSLRLRYPRPTTPLARAGEDPDDLCDRRAVHRRHRSVVRRCLPGRLHPLRLTARTGCCSSIRTSASTAARASRSARSTRSTPRTRCRPSGRTYTELNARWFKDKDSARADDRRVESRLPDRPDARLARRVAQRRASCAAKIAPAMRPQARSHAVEQQRRAEDPARGRPSRRPRTRPAP